MWAYFSFIDILTVVSNFNEEKRMAKSQEKKPKEVKKKPQKSLKEKRAAKKEKKGK